MDSNFKTRHFYDSIRNMMSTENIVSALREKPLSMNELHTKTGLQESTIYKHLDQMKGITKDRILKACPNGERRFYSTYALTDPKATYQIRETYTKLEADRLQEIGSKWYDTEEVSAMNERFNRIYHREPRTFLIDCPEINSTFMLIEEPELVDFFDSLAKKPHFEVKLDTV